MKVKKSYAAQKTPGWISSHFFSVNFGNSCAHLMPRESVPDPFLIGPQWLIVVNTFSYPYELKRMKNTMSFIFSPFFCNVSFVEKCHRYLPSVGWLHLHSSRMMTTTCWVLIFAIAQREERYKSKLWELARCSTTLENGKHPLAQNCNVLQLATTKSNATFLCKITMIVHSHWPSKLCSSSTKGQTTTPKIIIE